MSALAIRAVTSGCTTCQGLFLAQKIAVDVVNAVTTEFVNAILDKIAIVERESDG